MEDNIKFAAAYLHIMDAASILDGCHNDIAETLTQLADWLRTTHNITGEDISFIRDIKEKIADGDES